MTSRSSRDDSTMRHGDSDREVALPVTTHEQTVPSLIQQIGGYTHSSERAVRLHQWLLTSRPENSSVARRLANYQQIEENSVYRGVS